MEVPLRSITLERVDRLLGRRVPRFDSKRQARKETLGALTKRETQIMDRPTLSRSLLSHFWRSSIRKKLWTIAADHETSKNGDESTPRGRESRDESVELSDLSRRLSTLSYKSSRRRVTTEKGSSPILYGIAHSDSIGCTGCSNRDERTKFIGLAISQAKRILSSRFCVSFEKMHKSPSHLTSVRSGLKADSMKQRERSRSRPGGLEALERSAGEPRLSSAGVRLLI